MKKFLVLYCMPAAGLAEWMKMPAEERKAQEDAMMTKWNAWMEAHAEKVEQPAGAGANKRVTPDGIADVKNDVMLYGTVEAESTEAAAELFKDHPHLDIPGSWIDVMPHNALPGTN